ncbi:E3 ubiquitin-protein ligase TRIM47-like [Cottoperca gobio]|uniref:E3 ubiquitin-protein ligase TRIM47-like n=1 Tax=Cottoperca gobio TaxID=56716 RepID=A0A6J2QZB4_COTGO|nr:E3 ubiquitin-protein ligase TRIM47-like [Cottoperca gobio]
MSAATCPLTEDQFLCPICLDLFNKPVATPCGHNFCKTCITKNWDTNFPSQCPVCKEVFYTRPELRLQHVKSEDISCDICTGIKLKALKSCLVCLASYCVTHLEPHLTVMGLTNHQLINPVENLEGRMCKMHNKPLELFCKTDQKTVCMLCMFLDHKTHKVVPLKGEYEEKKVELGMIEDENQQMIQKRLLNVQQIKRSVELSNEAAHKEKADGVQVLTALKEFVERSLVEIFETIEEKQRLTEKQAESLINELEQDISELMKRSAALEQLSHSEDHLQFIETFPSQCPVCKEVFYTRPELRVNTLISQMADQFRQPAEQKASSSNSELQHVKSEDISCDICTGIKLKALKSCLVCLASYCVTHLEPHLTVMGLTNHQLINPVENLEGRMCKMHNKPLELFCKTDQKTVCMLCMFLDHKTHKVVPLKGEYEEKKVELGMIEDENQQMIQKRLLNVQQIKRSVELSNEAAHKEKADGVQVLTALKEFVERSLVEIFETIEEKQRLTEKQAESLINELEQDISELMKRSAALEQLSHSEDHLQFIETFPSLKAAPSTKDWTEVGICPPMYEGTVVRAVEQLEEMLSKEMKKVIEAELKRVQQYVVDVTLDPETANPWLILSQDGKQVNCGEVYKEFPDNPERFSYYASVLGKQSFTSGRFYYEVQVTGKTKWDLGVVRESINRKKQITMNPQSGYWTISLRNENEYKALADPRVHLSLRSEPEKVGVLVDYEECLVSFYDVDSAALLYSFTGCSFTEKLYPFFNPCSNDGGKNSAPMIICPLRHVKVNLMRIYSRIRTNRK